MALETLDTTEDSATQSLLPTERIPIGAESRLPGLLLGASLGGFVDGIGFHQIAQWHNMASSVLPPTTVEAMKLHMAWDGWFHAATLLLTVIGVYLLVNHARNNRRLPSPGRFSGLLMLGWGLFNVVEGVVDHHVLHIHHVHDLPVHVPLYDWIFLGMGGAGFIVIGYFGSRLEDNRTPAGPIRH